MTIYGNLHEQWVNLDMYMILHVCTIALLFCLMGNTPGESTRGICFVC